MKRSISIAALTLLFATSAMAQKTIQEVADLPDKKFDKLTSSTVNTYAPNVLSLAKTYKKNDFPIPDDLTPKLNRVGLATFFLVDNNWVEISKAGQGGWGSYETREDYLTPAGSETFINQFYQEALPAIKKAFSDQGFEILLPEEFCDTPEKKQAYESREFEVSGLATFSKGLSSHLTKTYDKNPAVPEGFNLFAELSALEGMDKKLCAQAGSFCKDLGLDAILTVRIDVELDGNELKLKGVKMILHGPNPIPENDYGKMNKYYFEGICIYSLPLTLSKPIVFANIKKKKDVENSDIGGFDTVMSRLASKLLTLSTTSYKADAKAPKPTR